MLCGSHRKHESLVLEPPEDAFASGGEINWGSKGNNYRGKNCEIMSCFLQPRTAG